MNIEHIPLTIGSAEATKTVRAAESEKRIRLLALHATTEAGQADFVIEDEDGNNIGGRHHMGTGTGGRHHSTVTLINNPNGWCQTPVGKGLQIANEDGADIELIAVVAIV